MIAYNKTPKGSKILVSPKSKNYWLLKMCPKQVIAMGYGTKAHGIRHNWLSGIRHTLRLDLGTIHLGWMELGTNFSQGVDMKI